MLNNAENDTINENKLNNTGAGAALGSMLLYKPFTIGVYVPHSNGTIASIPYLTTMLSSYSLGD